MSHLYDLVFNGCGKKVDLLLYNTFDSGPYRLVPFPIQTSKIIVTREMFYFVTI